MPPIEVTRAAGRTRQREGPDLGALPGPARRSHSPAQWWRLRSAARAAPLTQLQRPLASCSGSQTARHRRAVWQTHEACPILSTGLIAIIQSRISPQAPMARERIAPSAAIACGAIARMLSRAHWCASHALAVLVDDERDAACTSRAIAGRKACVGVHRPTALLLPGTETAIFDFCGV